VATTDGMNPGDEYFDYEMAHLDEGSKCPECGIGVMEKRRGRHGQFMGCSEYPKCDLTKSVN